jgi:predicted phage-related endonuclease
VTGKREAYVAPLIGGNDPRIIRVPYDEELLGMMVARCKRFWLDNVTAGEQPEVDGNPAWDSYFEKRFPSETRDHLTSSPELDEIAEKLIDVRARIELLEAEKTLHENQLKAAIGAHAGLVGPWGRVSWKANSAGNVQWKKVAEALNAPAELIESARGKPARVFKVTPAADSAAAQKAA